MFTNRIASLALPAPLLAALCLPAGGRLPAEAPAGKWYALLVGVQSYDHSKLPDLKYTENDIEELARLLGAKPAGFATVTILTSSRGKARAGDRPTIKNLRAVLRELLARKTKHDSVLIALAGHGVQLTVPDPRDKTKTRDEAFFCPADAQLGDRTTLIGLNKLFNDLDECGAGVKLLLVDACRNDPKLGRNVDVDNVPRPPRGTAALFSCASGQQAFETAKLGKGHGVFFHFVLEGLRGRARNEDGEVTWDDLTAYVKRQVPRAVVKVIGDGAQQSPHLVANIVNSPVLLRSQGRRPGYLGVGLRVLLPPEAERLKLPDSVGVGVRYVMPGLAGDRAGLRQGDVFLRIDGKRVTDLQSLVSIIGGCQAGADVEVEVLRGGGRKQVSVTLGEKLTSSELFERFKRAAAKGSAWAKLQVGYAYEHGDGVAKDEKESVRWFRQAAELGDAEAQSQLGWTYYHGQGVPTNYAEAIRWYRKAAGQGNAIAQSNLADMHYSGTGVKRDYAEAARLYRLAAEQGNAIAQRALGWLYANGQGVARDDKVAVEWYRKAADQGEAAAQYNLADMYLNGRGVTADARVAAGWYRRAAEQGHAAGQGALGAMYLDGRGVLLDYKLAAHWLRKAADQGHATSQNSLGFLYQNGRGVAASDKDAVFWYRKAVDQALADGQNNLGAMYMMGRGVAADDKAATQWFRKSAEQGHSFGQFNLGLCYELGRGVAKDVKEAVRWYRLAAAQGNARARANLRALEPKK
jgi:TPR repeat protein